MRGGPPSTEPGNLCPGPRTQAPVLEQACRGRRRKLPGSRQEASGNRPLFSLSGPPSPGATSTVASTQGPGAGVALSKGPGGHQPHWGRLSLLADYTSPLNTRPLSYRHQTALSEGVSGCRGPKEAQRENRGGAWGRSTPPRLTHLPRPRGAAESGLGISQEMLFVKQRGEGRGGDWGC